MWGVRQKKRCVRVIEGAPRLVKKEGKEALHVPEQVFHCSLWRGPCCSRYPFCSPWRIPHQGRWIFPAEGCSGWRAHAGAGFPNRNCDLWRTYAAVEETSEEKAAAERNCYGLTTTPHSQFPCTAQCSREGVEKGMKEWSWAGEKGEGWGKMF